MKELFRRIAEALARGEEVGLARILDVQGSAPAPEGSRLALFASGERAGTVGGGPLEAGLLEALGRGEEGVVELDLGAGGQEPGMLCGGRVEVLLERLAKDSAEPFQAALRALERGHSVAAGVLLAGGRVREREFLVPGRAAVPDSGTGPLASALAAALASGRTVRRELDPGVVAHAELVRPTPRLVVIGAGHVGLAAARVAVAASMRFAVVDDRPALVGAERFPDADPRLVALPGPGLARIAPGPADAVLVATRSVDLDREGVLAAAATGAFYVGLLGSRRKWERLSPAVAAGAGEEAAARVRSPAGLDIGARSPGEIAVAVVAEVLSVWRRG